MDDPQTHLVYLLLDSNLPTGGFVASSGLESWVKHGFLGNQAGYEPSPSSASASSGSQPKPAATVPASMAAGRITEFVDAELENYARATGLYVRDAWRIVREHLDGGSGARCGKCGKRSSRSQPDATTSKNTGTGDLESALEDVLRLDRYHEATLLSHVSRRASKAQGVAILTLYTKGLSAPPSTTGLSSIASLAQEGQDTASAAATAVVEGYKRLIRKGTAPGHLATCWGAMTAALGLSFEKSYHLYLFLHARSLLSAAVRLNSIGPYLSSQLLLHPLHTIIARHSTISPDSKEFETSLCPCTVGVTSGRGTAEPDFWDWTRTAEIGAATTWPLGEVLIARHDLQHSRIFNS